MARSGKVMAVILVLWLSFWALWFFGVLPAEEIKGLASRAVNGLVGMALWIRTKLHVMEIINAFKDWAKMYRAGVFRFGITLTALSIVAVVVIAWRYKKRWRKMKEHQKQLKAIRARLNKLTGGSKKPRL